MGVGIHVSGGVSGAHINPAITTTLALFKRFQWRKVIPYIVAQTLGAFVAAFLIWAVYKTSLRRRRASSQRTPTVVTCRWARAS
ncbi:hypothetical protein PI124_g10242 [Phytophthora idaei]|nr:hypothetical protein PI125_g17331 [Phytophthora idaei]KAG3245007.1 hypothetical protein PI124_g10242 [Phytophthora idaei]